MKTLQSVGLLALFLFASCAGMVARGDAMATIASTYRNIIQPIVVVGIGAEQDAGGITAERAAELRAHVDTLGRVLEGGNVAEARAAWDILLPFAEAGIDARVARGEIGPGVGASLKEVLRLFGARLLQLQGPGPVAGLTLTPAQQGAVQAVLR